MYPGVNQVYLGFIHRISRLYPGMFKVYIYIYVVSRYVQGVSRVHRSFTFYRPYFAD